MHRHPYSHADFAAAPDEDNDGADASAGQLVGSFFELEELLPDEMHVYSAGWSSWRTSLAKQFRALGRGVCSACLWAFGVLCVGYGVVRCGVVW